MRRFVLCGLCLLFLAACADDSLPTLPPTIILSADADTITAGESTRLRWVVTGDEPISLLLSPEAAVAELTSPLSVSPTETTTYTLTASNAAGAASSRVTITVIPAADLPDDPPNNPDAPTPTVAIADFVVSGEDTSADNTSVRIGWILQTDTDAGVRCVLELGDGNSVTVDPCTGEQRLIHRYAQAGTYTVTLTATTNVPDAQATTQTASVTVPASELDNTAPNVSAGENLTVQPGERVTLVGQANDSDGDALTVNWTVVQQPEGSDVQLMPVDALETRFTPDVIGTYVFGLRVLDGNTFVTDEVSVVVADEAIDEVTNRVRFVSTGERLTLRPDDTLTLELERFGSTREALTVTFALAESSSLAPDAITLAGVNATNNAYQATFATGRSRVAFSLTAGDDAENTAGSTEAFVDLVLIDADTYDLATPQHVRIIIAKNTTPPEQPTLRACPGDFVVTSQADLEPLKGCTRVDSLRVDPQAESSFNTGDTNTGDTNTGDTVPLTSLAPLANLQSVSGYLTIANTALTSLTGLEQLTRLGDNRADDGLFVTNNDALTSLNALAIDEINGNIVIADNALLTDLRGLDNLTESVSITIENNPALTSLAGLEQLVRLLSFLALRDNPVLTSLAGLSRLTDLQGGLRVTNNNALTSLAGLDNLASIDGTSSIISNDALVSLTGLGSVTIIGPGLTISDNASLATLAGLESLRSSLGITISRNPVLTDMPLNSLRVVGSLSITDNDALTSLAGLEPLRRVETYLSIGRNNALVSVEGLNNLEHTGGFTLYENASLADVTALANLREVSGFLYIQDNDALTSLIGLERLERLGDNINRNRSTRLGIPPIATPPPPPGSRFHIISDNDALVSLEGLSGLRTVTEGLRVTNNAALVSLAGLSDLETLFGTLQISENASLMTLAEPQTLREIAFDLVIRDNPQLVNVAGLAQLETIGGNLIISNNVQLRDVMGLAALETINEDITITNNLALTSLAGVAGISGYDDSNFVNISDNPNLDCTAVTLPYVVDVSVGNAVSCRQGAQVPLCVGDFTVGRDGELADLLPLAACTNITGNLTITGYRSEDLSLEPLANLQRVGGALQINRVTSLIGLENLTSVGSLLLVDNPQVTTLANLNLTTIERDLRVVRMDGLSNLEGLSAVDRIVNLNVTGNDALTSLTGLNAQLSGGMRIQDNAVLASLGGISTAKTLTGSFRLIDNPQLRRFAGSLGVTRVEGSVEIIGNALDDLSGLAELTEVGAILSLKFNRFATLVSLENLTRVGGEMILQEVALTSLTGLEGLLEAGALQISGRNLTSLTGLDNLAVVQSDVAITSNDALASLTGLGNLTTIGGALIVLDNASLMSLDALNLETIAGDIVIGAPRGGGIPGNRQLTSLAGLETIRNYDDSNSVQVVNNPNLDCTPPPVLPFTVDVSADNAVNCPTG